MLAILIGCSEADEPIVETTEDNQAIIEEMIDDMGSDSVDMGTYIIEDSTMAQLWSEGELIAHVDFDPLVPFTEIHEEGYTYDDAFLLANCMVVSKRITVNGPFCHLPEAEQVMIYTCAGDTITLGDDERSNSFDGFTLAANFQGGGLTSPDGSWGIITQEAEGDFYGFTILRNDGSCTDVAVYDDLGYPHSLFPEFPDSNSAVYNSIGVTPDGDTLMLIVRPSGEYEVMAR